jgi:hypothetical protein
VEAQNHHFHYEHPVTNVNQTEKVSREGKPGLVMECDSETSDAVDDLPVFWGEWICWQIN